MPTPTAPRQQRRQSADIQTHSMDSLLAAQMRGKLTVLSLNVLNEPPFKEIHHLKRHHRLTGLHLFYEIPNLGDQVLV